MRFEMFVAVAVASLALGCQQEAKKTEACEEDCVSTFAGTGLRGAQDGKAAEATFYHPRGIALADKDVLWVADAVSNRVRRISGGEVSTAAGTGDAGYADGPALEAKLSGPVAVVASGGKVYVTDRGNARIRLLEGGKLTTLAGSGEIGYADGAATEAKFKAPEGLAIDPKTSGVLVADFGNHCIRLVDGGQVTTVAGTSSAGFEDGATASARFTNPSDIAVARDGSLLVADTGNHRIRRIAGGAVTTIAGSGEPGFADGDALKAKLKGPAGLAIDAKGVVYVADWLNHRIRALADGKLTTLAGPQEEVEGEAPSGFADATFKSARFKSPFSVGVGVDGKVYVADTGNNRIRVLARGKAPAPKAEKGE